MSEASWAEGRQAWHSLSARTSPCEMPHGSCPPPEAGDVQGEDAKALTSQLAAETGHHQMSDGGAGDSTGDRERFLHGPPAQGAC